MGDLYIGLAAAGVVIVGLFYGYNVFQEWRFRDKTDKSFAREQDDVLIDRPLGQVRDGDRLDPVILETQKSTHATMSAPSEFTRTKLMVESTPTPQVPEPEAQRAVDAPSVPITRPEHWSVSEAEVPEETLEPISPEEVVAVAAAVVEEMSESKGMKPSHEPEEVEPATNVLIEPSDPEPPASFHSDMASVGEAVHTPEPVVMNDQQLFVRALLDPAIDFMAELRFETPTVLPSLPQFSSKSRIQILGANERGEWQVAVASPTMLYSRLDIGLQMVSRQGVIAETELQRFCAELNQFASHYSATVQHPQQTQQLALVRDLDAFCAEVDILIGLNVRLRAPTAFARLLEVTDRLGLVRQPDGCFHALSESGTVLFTVTGKDDLPFEGEWIEWVTVLLDVPRVAGGLEVFERALSFTREVSRELNGILVDDNNRTLLDSGLDSIRARLVQIYNRMDDRGIAPGSMVALRVFQ